MQGWAPSLTIWRGSRAKGCATSTHWYRTAVAPSSGSRKPSRICSAIRSAFFPGGTARCASTTAGCAVDKCNLESQEKHPRSEEHTSELQSRENLVCRLLLEKKSCIYTLSN